MFKIVAALLLTLSLVVGQDGFDGFELGSAFLSPETTPAFADLSGGGSQSDVSGKPLHLCTRLSCTQSLSMPERLTLLLDAYRSSDLSPGDDRGPMPAALQQDPPVPRA